MFKKKPPEGSGSPQAAAPGGKAGFLRRRWPLLVIAGAAIVGGAVWMTQVRATQAPAEAAYIETKPTRRSITNIYSEDGTVEAAESYQVKSLVRGDVLTADFEEGDMVQEGDVLYTIDSADAVNSVERAQLTLSQAQRDYEDAVDAQYVRTGIGGTVVSIAAAPGDVVTAGQEIATIRDESAMLLTLDFPAADAAQFAAEQAADSLRSAELSMEDAENTLDDYTITAPISGTVIMKGVQAGETIGADTSTSEVLCIIHDLSYLEMEIAVDELDILSIQKGQQATIVADALEDETFTGVVTNVSSNGTTTSGTTTYPVTIRIDDYGELMPGMNATVSIVVDSAENALSIPNGAVVRGGYVLVTADSPSAANAADMAAPDGYVYVRVETGVSDDSYVEVVSGLTEDDTVAYDADAAALATASDSGMMMPGGMPGGGGGMPSGGLGGGPM